MIERTMRFKPVPGWGHIYEMGEDAVIYSKERRVARGSGFMRFKRKKRKAVYSALYPNLRFVQLYEMVDGKKRQETVFIHKLKYELWGDPTQLTIMKPHRPNIPTVGTLDERLERMEIGQTIKTSAPSERASSYVRANRMGITVKTKLHDGIIYIKRTG